MPPFPPHRSVRAHPSGCGTERRILRRATVRRHRPARARAPDPGSLDPPALDVPTGADSLEKRHRLRALAVATSGPRRRPSAQPCLRRRPPRTAHASSGPEPCPRDDRQNLRRVDPRTPSPACRATRGRRGGRGRRYSCHLHRTHRRRRRDDEQLRPGSRHFRRRSPRGRRSDGDGRSPRGPSTPKRTKCTTGLTVRERGRRERRRILGAERR